MTVGDKKKAQILVGLIVVAGLTWFLIYRTGIVTSSADATKAKVSTKDKGKKPLQDPTIHSELIQSADAGTDVGRKNIFQYGQKPLPPAPPPTSRPNPVPVVTNTPPPVYAPLPQQPPPFKAFKYEGLSIAGSPKTGKAMASLTEGTNTYQVTVGECLMGQYCVRQINEKEIEIEDVQAKPPQRRTFPKTPPQ